MNIGEIAAPATGNSDLFGGNIRVIKDKRISAAARAFNGTHQARGAGTDYKDIKVGGFLGG